jgi:hypothetical protein
MYLCRTDHGMLIDRNVCFVRSNEGLADEQRAVVECFRRRLPGSAAVPNVKLYRPTCCNSSSILVCMFFVSQRQKKKLNSVA